MAKKTEDLLKQLKAKNISYEDYLFNNNENFIECDCDKFWSKIFSMTDMKKADIINKADIGYTFFYDIIRCRKKPSRDSLIRIFMAIKLDLEYLQEALRVYEYAALYPKIKRDSIIIFCVNRKFTLSQSNELLAKNNEKALK